VDPLILKQIGFKKNKKTKENIISTYFTPNIDIGHQRHGLNILSPVTE